MPQNQYNHTLNSRAGIQKDLLMVMSAKLRRERWQTLTQTMLKWIHARRFRLTWGKIKPGSFLPTHLICNIVLMDWLPCWHPFVIVRPYVYRSNLGLGTSSFVISHPSQFIKYPSSVPPPAPLFPDPRTHAYLFSSLCFLLVSLLIKFLDLFLY